jgi:hypothetical protein
MVMKTKQRSRLRTLTCPDCGQKGKLQRIVYGMPGDDFDFEKYAVGGCLIQDDQPDIRCRECGWNGLKDLLEQIKNKEGA